MVKILYFYHFSILHSSLNFKVFQAVVGEKIVSLLLFCLLFSLPFSPRSELGSLGTYVPPWWICVLRVRIGNIRFKKCALVSCLLSSLVFGHHNLTFAVFSDPYFTLWYYELASATDICDTCYGVWSQDPVHLEVFSSEF